MARFVAQMSLFTNEYGAWKVVDTDQHRMIDFYKSQEDAIAAANLLNLLSAEGPDSDPQDQWETELMYGDADV